MAKTYTPGGASDLNDVRAALMDTGLDGFEMALHDEEILRVLSQVAPVQEAKAQLAERLAVYWGKQAQDWMEANRREMFRDRANLYNDLASRFRSETVLDADGLGGGSFQVGSLRVPNLEEYLQ
jgi:hypothetical protein